MRNEKSILEKRFNLNISGKTITCNKCGFVWSVKKLRYDRNMSCPNCHPIEHGSSRGECELYDVLLTTGLQIKHNDRIVLEGKELDLYFPDLKFAIEYNGEYWHNKEKDDIKDKLCKEKGIKLLRIDDKDFTLNKNSIINKIINFINTNYNLNIKTNEIKDIIRVSSKAQKIICTDTGEIFNSYLDAAKSINCSPPSIGNVCNGTYSNIKGYHFKYYQPDLTFEKTEKKYEYKTKHIKCVETNEIFPSLSYLKKIGFSSVWDCVSGKQKTSHRLHWEYTEEPVNFSDKFLNFKPEKLKKEKSFKKVKCVDLNLMFNSLAECAAYFNAPNTNSISRVIRGDNGRKTYKGHTFVYLQDNQ